MGSLTIEVMRTVLMTRVSLRAFAVGMSWTGLMAILASCVKRPTTNPEDEMGSG